VAKKPLLRVIAALTASAAAIFMLSLIKSGPSSAPDFDCLTSLSSTSVRIDISAGETGSEIAQELFEKGVVKSSEAFFRVAVSDPRSASIAPGVHIVDEGICARDALVQLLDSKRIAGLIAFTEGAWNREIKEIFIKSGFSKRDVDLAFESVNVPPPFATLEGLLFPAQYSFAQGTKAIDALESIVERGLSTLTTLGIVEGNKKFTAQELLVIASIIQAEGDEKDFTKVARVIYNRLAIDMPLQMDSTVHYIKGTRGSVFLSTNSTLIKSPYNTYRNYGLPPGPIGNPGESALKAALSPVQGDWLYFITVAPGDTRFTSTLTEFNQWKVLYKSNLRAGKFGDSK
jgi:UPF0755 protein